MRVQCTGIGIQRFKFKEVVIGAPRKAVESRRLPPRNGLTATGTIIRAPSNGSTKLLDAFIEKLQVRDSRYDLCWAYGGLLKEIPKRLGTNAALDASVLAVVTVVSSLGTKSKSPEVFSRYGAALAALKTSLHDPIAVQSSSTLCAIYLVWICQVRILLSS